MLSLSLFILLPIDDLRAETTIEQLVKKIVKLENIGKKDLELKSLSTSCMCTTVVVINKGKRSPEFGMHDNPKDWSKILKAGDFVRLEIAFDPGAHGPDAVGEVRRTVNVYSSDPIDSEREVKFRANVIK